LAVEYPCHPGAGATAPPTAAPPFAGAVVAGMMAAEGTRLLAGAAPSTGQEIAFDLLHRRFLVTRLRRAPACRFDHEVMGELLGLGKDFASATVGDLLSAAERTIPGLSHLQCRRNLFGSGGFESARLVPVERLRPHAGQPLRALGFTPADRVRARASGRSVWIALDGPRKSEADSERIVEA
jgi:hypothetical protein